MNTRKPFGDAGQVVTVDLAEGSDEPTTLRLTVGRVAVELPLGEARAMARHILNITDGPWILEGP